jgi:YfiH family protein
MAIIPLPCYNPLMREHGDGDLRYFTYDSFEEQTGVVNIVSTRLGGVSPAPYATLNLGFAAGDRVEAVLENRAILCRANGVDPRSLTTAKQVHETRVAVITDAERGRGAQSYETGIPMTDAMITNVPGIPLMILVADCVAVSFFDPVRRAVGVAHASWRGTLGRIAEKTAAAMRDAFGSNPADLCAGIGPSIGPCCYEVRSDVIDPFYEEFPDEARTFFSAVREPGAARAGGEAGRQRGAEGQLGKRAPSSVRQSTHLDLWAANHTQLRRAGIAEHNIETANLCTACRTELFYSYRKEKKTGRFGGLIMLTT